MPYDYVAGVSVSPVPVITLISLQAMIQTDQTQGNVVIDMLSGPQWAPSP